MANLTPSDAGQLGYTPQTAGLPKAMQDDPWAVLMAMLTGKDTAGSSGAGNLFAAQGATFNPTRSGNEAASLVESSNSPDQVRGSAGLDAQFRAGVAARPHENPYSTIVANQARPAQEALYSQMLAQQAGPSIAGMQGQRAQGQNLQAALGAGGGHAVMNQAGGVGAGLAGDTGMGQLAEQLRMSQGLGAMAGGVRGADLGVAGAQSQSGLQQRSLDDAMQQFYASQGAKLEGTNADLASERAKLLALGKIKRDARDVQMVKNQGNSMASTLSVGAA